MYTPNHPNLIGNLNMRANDLGQILRGAGVGGSVTPEGRVEDGPTVRETLEGMKRTIDAFLNGGSSK